MKVSWFPVPMLSWSISINHYSRPGETARVSFIEAEVWGTLAKEHMEEIKKGTKRTG